MFFKPFNLLILSFKYSISSSSSSQTISCSVSALLNSYQFFLSVLNLYKSIDSLNSLNIELSTCLFCSIVLLVDSIFVIKKLKKIKTFSRAKLVKIL